MEVIHKRILCLSAVMVVFGFIAYFQPKTKPTWRTEQWMEEHLPVTVAGGYAMIPSEEDPQVSYKMDEATYKELNPYGIVARTFDRKGVKFDTVVVAANERTSLHDPHRCFPGQNWTIANETKLPLQTRTRGTIHAMVLDLLSPEGVKLTALYTFRGPSGTFAVRDEMFWDRFVAELKGIRPEGALMRVMSLSPLTTREQLTQFAAEWYDESYAASGHVF